MPTKKSEIEAVSMQRDKNSENDLMETPEEETREVETSAVKGAVVAVETNEPRKKNGHKKMSREEILAEMNYSPLEQQEKANLMDALVNECGAQTSIEADAEQIKSDRALATIDNARRELTASLPMSAVMKLQMVARPASKRYLEKNDQKSAEMQEKAKFPNMHYFNPMYGILYPHIDHEAMRLAAQRRKEREAVESLPEGYPKNCACYQDKNSELEESTKKKKSKTITAEGPVCIGLSACICKKNTQKLCPFYKTKEFQERWATEHPDPYGQQQVKNSDTKDNTGTKEDKRTDQNTADTKETAEQYPEDVSEEAQTFSSVKTSSHKKPGINVSIERTEDESLSSNIG